MGAKEWSQKAMAILFGNEDPIQIISVLLHRYPQIEKLLQSAGHFVAVTSSKMHAMEFLKWLMEFKPQYVQIIKSIQQQLKAKRKPTNAEYHKQLLDAIIEKGKIDTLT